MVSGKLYYNWWYYCILATNTDGVYTINVPAGEVSTLDSLTFKIEDESPVTITASGNILGYDLISSQLNLTPTNRGD